MGRLGQSSRKGADALDAVRYFGLGLSGAADRRRQRSRIQPAEDCTGFVTAIGDFTRLLGPGRSGPPRLLAARSAQGYHQPSAPGKLFLYLRSARNHAHPPAGVISRLTLITPDISDVR